MKKVSLRVRNFDKERFLTFNIDNDASLDEELLDFIEDEEPVGIVPVIFEEGEEFDTFSYDITDKIHLSELSNQEINAEMVLKVLHSLIVSLVDMAEYRVPLSYLVLHRDYIYVDSDYKIEFICIPVEEMQEDVDINSFLRAFLASLRYELSENCNYVAKLLTYVNNEAVFNLRNMVTLVEELMDDMGIEIPEEDSTEIYADYQEVMDEAEELENEDEEEELTEEDESDSDEADEEEPLEETSSEEEDADDESQAEEETEVDDDQETETDEDDISADDEDDAETSEDEIEEDSEDAENEEDEQEEPEKEEEPVVSKSSKKSAFTLRKPEPDEEEEEEDESPLQEDLKEEDEQEDESVEVEEFDDVINDEEENLPEDEGEVSEEDFDTEGDDDTYEANEEEVLEEPVEEEKTSKKTLFKTKEATVTGVVIEDELDEFLAEKEREDQLAHFEDNGLKIKKNIKVNRASIVKNTQEELKAEEEEAKAEEEENVDEEEEEEEVVGTSILSQTLGATGILKSNAAVPKVNPYLIRTNTKERVMITKQNFKIGKANMGVDYTVKGNGAVSRTHAIITNKDGVYYIKDNKSTNHTYVNNKLVEEGENELLTHDCKIVLGDEEFTFKLR
jgi:pSer/pThr/pTyr-binding forkhead associated (FHA) protein